MFNLKRRLNELNYEKIAKRLNWILDLRETGVAPDSAELMRSYSINDELIFTMYNLDIDDSANNILAITDTIFVACSDKINSSQIIHHQYVEYNPIKDDDLLYTMIIIGKGGLDLDFITNITTLLILNMTEIEIGNNLHVSSFSYFMSCVDIVIAVTRAVDTVMDLKYGTFDQYKSCGKYNKELSVICGDDLLRRVYDYAITNQSDHLEYNKIVRDIYKKVFASKETEV